MHADGGLVEDFPSADFTALLGKEDYAVVVKTRDVSHVIYASECGCSGRGGIRSGHRGFCFETPATCDSVDAHRIGGEESKRNKERLESLLEPLGVIFIEDNEGVGEGIEVGDPWRNPVRRLLGVRIHPLRMTIVKPLACP